ncbi:hypothetical protein HA402_006005 [Bradysia odoriphaga]|nr:hypothetical protein HA402_006005 [Bradysia odoriphaga]
MENGWSVTESFIVLSGPNNVLNTSTGLYQQSVTLTARMWPPIEAGSPKIIWGLPVVIWSIIIGFIVVAFILASLLLCCWLLPRHRKILSPTRDCTSTTVNIVAHNHHSAPAEQNYIIMPTHAGTIPSQYNTPHQINQYPSQSLYAMCSSGHGSAQNIPETHKSMWAINPLCTSNGVLNETDSAYRTRSLPAWGKGSKQRPVSTADDIEELYAKVNFSKKRKNRMRNGEAAIIALCRSRSQNLQGLPLEREGIVIYDERTAL